MPMSEAPGPVTVTVETKVDSETAARYYQLYHDTFSALQVKAVARQLLHEDEFFDEMATPGCTSTSRGTTTARRSASRR